MESRLARAARDVIRGLVVGKFLPPHAGHLYLIDTARAHCDALTVMVCAKPSQEIDGALRAAWLRELEPDVDVVLVDDNLGDDDSEGWARETIRTLGRAPDVVFTSEAYGDAYAGFLGCRHHSIDPARAQVPIAATAIRENPVAQRAYLAPAVRAYYVPRIVLAGAESTGKTTLARTLAERFNVPWVPEYGRAYTEAKYRGVMLTDDWRADEFVHIAREQERQEDAAARADVPFIVADTDAFVTRIWYERYLGAPPSEPGWPLDRARERIYLIPEPDVAFVQDGIRDGEHYRAWMHAATLDALARLGRTVHVLRGDYPARTAEAIAIVGALSP